MSKKIIWIIVGVVIIILAVIFLNRTPGAASPSKAGSAAAKRSAPVTVSGWIFCLPRKNPSNECVIGIKDDFGRYYALVDQTGAPVNPSLFSTGSKESITGDIISDNGLQQKYNIQGTIAISQ
jgi:hypothetical protein